MQTPLSMSDRLSEDDLRSLYASRREPTRKTWRCLSESKFAAFVDGRLQSNKRTRVESHLASCNYCRKQLSDLIRMSEAEPLPRVPQGLIAQARTSAKPQPRSSSSMVWGWTTAFAGAAIVLLLVSFQEWRSRAPQPAPLPATSSTTSSPMTAPTPVSPPEESSRTSDDKSADPQLVSPREGASFTKTLPEFRWTPVSGSISYEIEVLDSKGTVVWSGRADSTRLELPPSQSLLAGNYYVWVRAHMPDGKTRRSPAVNFRVAAEP